MTDDQEISAGNILAARRAGSCFEVPAGATGIRTISAAEIVHAFGARFSKQCDVGMRRRVSGTVMEPANPFDPKSRRRVRQEAIVLGALVATTVALAMYFNLSAPLR
jgi:hypothetical protein